MHSRPSSRTAGVWMRHVDPHAVDRASTPHEYSAKDSVTIRVEGRSSAIVVRIAFWLPTHECGVGHPPVFVITTLSGSCARPAVQTPVTAITGNPTFGDWRLSRCRAATR